MNLKILACGLLMCACGRKTTAPPAAAAPAPATPAAPAAPEAPAAPAPSAPEPLITGVRPRWIIADSQVKAEILLLGQDLAADATVTSSSPLLTVEKVETGPFQTSVLARLDPNAPAGDYELQYLSPGRAPIPFALRYNGRR